MVKLKTFKQHFYSKGFKAELQKTQKTIMSPNLLFFSADKVMH